MDNELIEKVAKLIYQFDKLIDDKKIDEEWYNLESRDKYFYCAETIIPLIAGEIKKKLEEIGDFDYGHGDATTGDVTVAQFIEKEYDALWEALGLKIP